MKLQKIFEQYLIIYDISCLNHDILLLKLLFDNLRNKLFFSAINSPKKITFFVSTTIIFFNDL